MNYRTFHPRAKYLESMWTPHRTLEAAKKAAGKLGLVAVQLLVSGCWCPAEPAFRQEQEALLEEFGKTLP